MLDVMETKANEFPFKEESLKLSLEDTICSKKYLEGEVSIIKDDLVATSCTYFGREKK